MAYRNGNYAAFYVGEPFSGTNLGASATRDFISYNLLRAWKGADSTFPFNDSHAKNYNVRDGSDWETTLKPRIRERLRHSKNLVLFLSGITKSSRALREEVMYGIDVCGLPVIVVYPEYPEKGDIIVCSTGAFRQKVQNLWDNLPTFRDRMLNVPTIHVPSTKVSIRSALNDPDFMVNSAAAPGRYYYKC